MKHKQKRIPYGVILFAKIGDPEAMEMVLHHFDHYINAHSYHPTIEGVPNTGGGINVDIKARIQEKLMHQIMFDYDPTRLPKGEELEF